MDPEERDRLNRLMAESPQVMGWRIREETLMAHIANVIPVFSYVTNDDCYVMDCQEWNPCERWDHAGMCAKAFLKEHKNYYISLDLFDEAAGCGIYQKLKCCPGLRVSPTQVGDSGPEAIVRAIAAAKVVEHA